MDLALMCGGLGFDTSVFSHHSSNESILGFPVDDNSS
jgi:hypothetical protein